MKKSVQQLRFVLTEAGEKIDLPQIDDISSSLSRIILEETETIHLDVVVDQNLINYFMPY